ncbi:MAG: helix-hairpin-helix domain-containing protein [Saprospiraceae bacterium]
MKNFLLQMLHYSRAERAGTLALLIICGLIYLAPAVWSRFHAKPVTDFSDFQADVQAFRTGMNAATLVGSAETSGALFYFDPNTATQEDLEHLGLSEKVAAIICNYRLKGGHFRQAEDLKKIYSLAPADFERLRPWIRMGAEKQAWTEKGNNLPTVRAEEFPFDPNLIGEADLKRLGLSDHTVKGILNYRSKGGKFRQAEDFGKIYTLSAADFDRLAPYILIGETAKASMERPTTYSGVSQYPEKKFAAKGPLDINRAGMEDWLRLPGIGEKRARQIVKFRESLGGFQTVEQLAEMYGLPDSVFQSIHPLLNLESRNIRQINMNTASVDDLDRHPYISFKQATLIVNYRNQHGPFASAQEVTRIMAFTDKKWLDKVLPYLGVQ